jgi:guanylate kinase
LEAERYQHVVVNDDLAHAVASVGRIIDEESVKRERLPALGSEVDGVVQHLLSGLHQYAQSSSS